jgi:phenylpyruvate tautomerase PptA (4-oxalocrotonate tautomerase family)
MAIVRVEFCWPASPTVRRDVIEALGQHVAETLQVPPGDPTVIALAHAADDVVGPEQAGDHCTIVTVTLFAGRSVATKRRLYRAIMAVLAARGVPPDDVLMVLHEVPVGDWGVGAGGGVPASDVDLGFKIDV